jgi:hypothetical protein
LHCNPNVQADETNSPFPAFSVGTGCLFSGMSWRVAMTSDAAQRSIRAFHEAVWFDDFADQSEIASPGKASSKDPQARRAIQEE